MPKFGRRSSAQRATLHPKLQQIADAAIADYDYSIIKGYRGKYEQNKAVAEKRSTKLYPRSKHNKKPSSAMDCLPYLPTRAERENVWKNIAAFKEMIAVISYHAWRLGIKIECGGYWTKPRDYPHIQLANKEV